MERIGIVNLQGQKQMLNKYKEACTALIIITHVQIKSQGTPFYPSDGHNFKGLTISGTSEAAARGVLFYIVPKRIN